MKKPIVIDSKFYIQNRKKFVSQLSPNSIAIFFSADIFHRSADATHSFFQNPDLLYFSGIDQEETTLILYPDAPNPTWKEVLLVREINDHIKIWEGQKYTLEEARDISGVQNCVWNKSKDSLLEMMMHYADNIYFCLNEHDRAHYDGDYMTIREMKSLQNRFPAHQYKRSAPIVSIMRIQKSSAEIDVMQTAANITSDTFRSLLKEMKKIKYEFEIEAFITYQFMLSKATHAYHPIIASGQNSCVLHYNDNNQKLNKSDILLMDFGCSYAHYASDLSRTIPISGRFSPRQKQIYQATLDVFKHTRDYMSTKSTLLQVNDDARQFMEKKLIEIGLLDKVKVKNQDPSNPLYRQFFPHGVSHYLGLDVHDVGNHYQLIPSQAVLTCEPGIYIWSEKLGVRIENDIVVTPKGKNLDLLQNCPIEIAEIEDLMN